MNKIILLLFFLPSLTFGQKVVINGPVHGNSHVSSSLLKSIIAFKKGDLVIYDGFYNLLNVDIPIEEAKKNKTQSQYSFLILGEAAYFPSLKGFKDELGENGKWTLTSFPNCNLYYVEKLTQTPYINKSSSQEYKNDLDTKAAILKSSDNAAIIKLLSDISFIKRNNQLRYFNFTSSIIKLIDRNIPVESTTVRNEAIKYLQDIYFLLEGKFSSFTDKSQWEKWWNELCDAPAFPSLDLPKFTTKDIPIKESLFYYDEYGNDIQKVNNSIYWSTETTVQTFNFQTQKFSEFLSNNLFLSFMAVSDTDIVAVLRDSKGITLNHYNFKGPQGGTFIKIKGSDTLSDKSRVKIKKLTSGKYIIVFTSKQKLYYGIINEKGELFGGYKPVMPTLTYKQTTSDTSFYRTIKPIGFQEFVVDDIDVIAEPTRTVIVVATQTRPIEPVNPINSIYLFVLDSDYNIIDGKQIDKPDDNNFFYKYLHICKGENNYLVSWHNSFHNVPILCYSILNEKLEIISGQRNDLQISNIQKPVYSNGSFFIPCQTGDNMGMVLKLIKVDATSGTNQMVIPVYKTKYTYLYGLDSDEANTCLNFYLYECYRFKGISIVNIPLKKVK